MRMLTNTYDKIYHDNANERTDPKTTCQDTGHNTDTKQEINTSVKGTAYSQGK